MTASSEKFTASSWISGGEGVGSATLGRRILVGRSVVRYVDIRSVTKAGAVIGLMVHCILLILMLSQLHRIISFDIVEQEDESFTSWSVTAPESKKNISTWTIWLSSWLRVVHLSLSPSSVILNKPRGKIGRAKSHGPLFSCGVLLASPRGLLNEKVEDVPPGSLTHDGLTINWNK